MAADNLARQDTFSKPDLENASDLVFQIRFYHTALSDFGEDKGGSAPRAPLPGSTCPPARRAERTAERAMDKGAWADNR
ncbi:MAG: hypothetical protein CMF63_05900 [Magnetovibrio sp.]|nr:hypothetical protein [Magnetovibrio sp.]